MRTIKSLTGCGPRGEEARRLRAAGHCADERCETLVPNEGAAVSSERLACTCDCAACLAARVRHAARLALEGIRRGAIAPAA
jgi:hypothetical protein